MPSELLGELVREGKNSCPSRLALVWRDQEISYLTLDGQLDQVAGGLARRGVQEGDRIALYMHNVPQFVVAFYALQRLGAIPVPLNIYWKGRDLRYLLLESRANGVITVAPLYDRIKEQQEFLPELRLVVAASAGNQPGASPVPWTPWEELITEPFTNPVYTELDPIDPALIAFTGGRCGPSRPALLSHFNLLANCQQMQDLGQVRFWGDPEEAERQEGSAGLPGTSQSEVALLPLPLSNLFSLNIGLNLVMQLQGTAVLMERFDPQAALDLIEQRGCTLVFGSPAIFTEIVKAPTFQQAGLASVRYAFSYGGPLDPAISQEWRKKTGCPVFNCYGLTEASPLLCCEAGGQESTPGAVGPALPMVQLSLQGPGGPIQGTDEAGEVLAKGPNLMLGYFNPEDPANPLPGKNDGWLATSDLAMYGEQGNYRILDRKEDTLLLPSGDLVLPRDIELLLCEHPGIWDAAALPYTTPEGRTRMIAFVVLNEPGKSLTEPLLMHYCERKLPVALCPERIFFYQGEELPRLPNGAVWRRALRAQIPDYL